MLGRPESRANGHDTICDSSTGRAGAGYLRQHAVLPFDEGTSASSSGLAFEVEAGAILFRRPGYGRIWIFGFALLPSFRVGTNPSVITPPTESIPSLGFGLRLAL